MLKFINYQLDTEDKQKIIEQDLAQHIKQQLLNNMQAIQQYQPHLMSLINQLQLSDYAIFCTKYGKPNLASMNTGRVVYQADPEEEVRAEVQDFLQLAPLTRLRPLAAPAKAEPLPVKVDVILVFGLGLGHHLIELLQNCRISYLVIYEPQTDFFLGSLQTIDWQQLFEVAQLVGTRISLQIGNDGSSVVEDLQELQQLQPGIDHVYLYRHLCHPVSDEVFQFLLDNSGNPALLLKNGQQFLGFQAAEDYVGSRAKNILGHEASPGKSIDNSRFDSNMTVFKRLYPKIYEEFKAYKARTWQLRRDPDGGYNLWHLQRKIFLYDELEHDSECLLNRFLDEPFKDDVIIGLAPSEKFKSFIHYQYIEKLQDIFLKMKAKKTVLPDDIESIIVFGVALARHIELLSQQKNIKNLYICEPNLDFFYASLYVADWATLLLQAEAKEQRVYLNIGGNGSEYFHDLMGQFYQVGAYSIANTYLLQSYYTPQLSQAISGLRRQLKVVLAIGEYYDHARFGLAHTYQAIESGCHFMKGDPHSLNYGSAVKSVPVFIIANGPSLDSAADYIKKYQGQAILVSCGTTLRALHRLGIKPDFHAEIEQCRATFDWISQVNDPDYLKRINLISVNGIHPDTTRLFANTYLAFKDGEASTQVFRNSLVASGFNFSSLSYAYPTVSNLALNYMIKLGFNTIYLFGVDLGYIDVKQHHSKFSAYYQDNGKELYDYKSYHGNGTAVRGNFQPFVFTKPEFDVSKKLLEMVIANLDKNTDVYNCSDGVLIKGAKPLKPEYILIKDVLAKELALAEILQQAFYADELVGLADATLAKFDLKLLEASVNEMLSLIAMDVTDDLQAQQIIEAQWQYLKTTSQNRTNLFFYLYYGSANYFLTILTKLRSTHTDDADFGDFNTVLAFWRDYLNASLKEFIAQPIKFDQVRVKYFNTGS